MIAEIFMHLEAMGYKARQILGAPEQDTVRTVDDAIAWIQGASLVSADLPLLITRVVHEDSFAHC